MVISEWLKYDPLKNMVKRDGEPISTIQAETQVRPNSIPQPIYP